MYRDPKKPLISKLQVVHTGIDYNYDSHKDAGKLSHCKLIGGSWVSHWQSRLSFLDEYHKAVAPISPRHAAYRIRRKQRFMIHLEFARRGFWLRETFNIGSGKRINRLEKIKGSEL